MVKSKFKLYQIYENGRGNRVGNFICMIDAKNSKEALKKFKKIDKRKVVAVTDYGMRFLSLLQEEFFIMAKKKEAGK